MGLWQVNDESNEIFGGSEVEGVRGHLANRRLEFGRRLIVALRG